MEKKLHKSKMWDQNTNTVILNLKTDIICTLFIMDYEASVTDSVFSRQAAGKTQKPWTQSWLVESIKVLEQSVSYTAML